MKKLHLPVLLLVLMFIGTKGARSQTDSLYKNIPYNELFNAWSSSSIPKHWSVLNQKETGNTWTSAGTLGNGPSLVTLAKEGRAAAIASNATQQLNDWLISPQFQLRSNEKPYISFLYSGACNLESNVASCAPGKFEVRLSPNGGGNVTDFSVKLGEISVEQNFNPGFYPGQRTYVYTQLEYLLENYGSVAGENVRIAFHAISEPGSCGILIDSFIVRSLVLSPPPPITFTDVYQNTFTANWPASSIPVDYELVFSITKLSNPDLGGTRFTDLTVTNKTFNGLNPGTNYYIYVRNVSGYVKGDWSEGSIKTSCSSLNNYENDTLYKVDFSNLGCWEMRDYLNTTISWSINESKKELLYKNKTDNNGTGSQLSSDDWLFSPTFALSESIPYSVEIKLNAGIIGGGARIPEVFSVWFVDNIDEGNPSTQSTSVLLLPSKSYLGDVLIQLSLEDLMIRQGRIAIRDETSGRGGQLKVTSFSIFKSRDCIPVNDPVLESRSLTTAKVKWNSNGSSFIVKIKKGSDFNPELDVIGTDLSSDEVVRILVNAPEIQFSGLEQGTPYWVYISNKCSSDSSAWTKLIFRTKLIIDKLPWVDRFETFPRLENTNYDIETNWTMFNGNKDKAGTFYGLVAPAIKGYDYSAGITGTQTNKKDTLRDQWMVTPPIKVPLSEAFVSFGVFNDPYGGGNPDIYAVWVSRQGLNDIDTNQSNWEILAPNTSFASKDFNPVTYDLTKYKGDTIYLAIRNLSNRPGGAIFIDNFILDTVKPVINLPKAFSVVSTTINSATIKWESTAPKFDIRYREFFFNPDNEGIYYEYPTTDQKQITLPNLGSGRHYFVYIRSNYNGTAQPGVSPWMGPFLVNMGCGLQTVPFVETFDSWISAGPSELYYKKNPIGCWKLIDQNKEDQAVMNTDISVTFTSPNSVYSPALVGKGISLRLDNVKDEKGLFLVSPPIQFPTSGAVVSFWGSGTHGITKYNIRLTTKGNSLQDCKDATLYVENEEIPYERVVGQGSFVQKVHLLSDKNGLLFPGETVYVIIEVLPRGDKDKDYFPGFKMDDFMIEENISDCTFPTKLTKPSSRPGILTWESSANSFEVVYESRYFNPILNPETGTKVTVSKTGNGGEFNFSHLDAGKKYHVWVRGICAGGKTTKWINDTIFPSCGTPILVKKDRPFHYEFDGWQLGSAPITSEVCWSTEQKKRGSTFISQVGGAKINRTVVIPGFDTTEAWLISPWFELIDSSLVKFKVSAAGSAFAMEKFDVMVAVKNGDSEKLNYEVVAKDVFANNFKEVAPFYAFNLYKYKGDTIKIAIIRSTINKATNGLATYDSNPFIVSDFNILYPECSFATNVVIPKTPNAGSDAFKVSWDGMAGVTTTQWEIKYSRDEYFNPESDKDGLYVSNSTLKEFTFTIPERTRAIFYIRPSDGCNENALTRNWAGPFVVEHIEGIAPISTFPFVDDFENWGYTMNDFRAGWTTIDLDSHWFEFNVSTKFNDNFSGTGRPNKSGAKSALMINQSEAKYYHWDSWLISPAFDFDNTLGTTKYALEFWMYDNLPDKPKFSIYLADSKDLGRLKTPARFIQNFTIKTQEWNKVQIFLQDSIDAWRSSGIDLGNMYIGIWNHSDSSTLHSITIDDFRVFDFGVCAPVSDLVHEKIEGDSVKFTFTYKNANPDDVKVYYKVGMFDNENLPDGVQVEDATVGNGGDWFIELKNLNYSAEYTYYIQTTCGSDVFWSGAQQFKSDCKIIVNSDLPFTETFDTWITYGKRGNWGPWEVIDGNKDGASFTSGINDSYPSGRGSARFFHTASGVDTVDEWLISPAFVVPSQPEISAAYYTDANPEDFMFLIIKRSDFRKENGEFVLTAFEDTLKNFEKIFTNKTWKTETFNIGNSSVLSKFVGDTVYFVLHMYSDTISGKKNYLSFDNFKITSEHACFNTPTNLRLTGIDIDTASLSWDIGKNQTSWDIHFWEVGTTVVDSTLTGINFNKEVTLKNLKPKTNYAVKVRSNCAGDPDLAEVGPWSVVANFKTLPSCQDVTQFKITRYGGRRDVLKLSWLATATNPLHYEIRFKKASDPNSTFNDPANQVVVPGNLTSYEFNNLFEDVTYNFRIRKMCSLTDSSEWASAIIKTYYECIPSTVLEETAIDKWWADVKWDRANAGKLNPEPKYTVVYREAVSGNWIYAQTQTSVNSIRLSNLKSATNYEWYVLSECDLGYLVDSELKTFRTKDLDRFRVEAVPNNTTFGRIEGNEINEYDESTVITLTAIPTEGFKFINWTTADGEFLFADPTYTFTLTGHVSIKANFLEICFTPDGSTLDVTSRRADSAVFVWAPSTNAAHYIFEYQYADAAETEWEAINDIADTKITLTTLDPLTYYSWRVRSYCSPGNESELTPKATFITSNTGTGGLSHVDASKGKIMLIPNPAKMSHKVQVQIEGLYGNVSYSLVDLTGRVVLKKQAQPIANIEIDLAGIKQGVYFVKLTGEGWERVEKLVVVQ